MKFYRNINNDEIEELKNIDLTNESYKFIKQNKNEYYVIVTGGTKLTGGYSIRILDLNIKQKDNQNILEVFVSFDKPSPGKALIQILTHPQDIVYFLYDKNIDKVNFIDNTSRKILSEIINK